MITLIAAVAKNGVIGRDNTIPWHVPADFKHFRETTVGRTVIMGGRTWDSLPRQLRPLPDRYNIVVTRNEARRASGKPLAFVSSISQALALAYGGIKEEEIFVIGGSSIYEQMIGIADKLLISEIDLQPEGNVRFPDISDRWSVVRNEPRDGFRLKEYRLT